MTDRFKEQEFTQRGYDDGLADRFEQAYAPDAPASYLIGYYRGQRDRASGLLDAARLNVAHRERQITICDQRLTELGEPSEADHG